ncbi:hypothetical protein HMN09_01147500 [Mycena chlorophos]|uniref:F-box domain-containing protein n=1 Tax=Mycena chlorophos TaxID=658473 RepID=A0A8H6S8P5_MYCCL|nr:hypothetical protein HMN09_01147500 [Mycena chlorophos]
MVTAVLRAKIDDLTREIGRQLQVLHDLEASKRALQAELARVAVFPVWTLPPELLSEVFVHCLNEDAWLDPEDAPLVLMRVCRLWAQVAAATPALWRALRLCLGDWDDDELLGIMQTWFCSGRKTPLKVILAGDLSQVDLPTFMATLQRYAPYIWSLTIDLTARNLLLLQPYSLEMSQLRELEITVEDDEDDGQYADPVELRDVFVGTSQLVKVNVDQILPSSITLPWTQITTFQCFDYFLDEVLEVLCLIPTLLSLEVTLGIEYNRDPSREKVTHTHLKNLIVMEQERLERRDTPHLLHFLTLPNLESLKTEEMEESTLRFFMQRSGYPPFKSMQVNLVGLPYQCHGVCKSILPHLAGLDDLSLSCPSLPFAQAFFSGLAVRQSFVPRLKRLAIAYDELTISSQQALVSMLELFGQAVGDRNLLSQIAPVERLTAVSFTVKLSELATLRIPESSLVYYKRLIDDGVEVHVGTAQESLL